MRRTSLVLFLAFIGLKTVHAATGTFSENFHSIIFKNSVMDFKNSASATAGFEKDQKTVANSFLAPQPTLANVDIHSSSYDSAWERYQNAQCVVGSRLVYRGDSRFPWKVWEAGGFWAKAKGSGQYSAALHQQCPSCKQDIVATTSDLNVALLTATSIGQMDSWYFPELEKYNEDQTQKNWMSNHGYVYALWIEKGVDLDRYHDDMKRYNDIYSFGSRYKWEQEIALLGGLDRSRILAIREVVTPDPKDIHSKNVFGSTIYINRHFLKGSDIGLPDAENLLESVVANLAQVTRAEAATHIAKLRQELN